MSSPSGELNAFLAGLGLAPGRPLPPVHLWNPVHCGDIGMEIRADGSWYHEGRPISRPAMVRVFASILRKDEGGYFLVTPVEKVSVKVEDAPFVAIRADLIEESESGPAWVFQTNVGDVVVAGAGHGLRMGRGHNGQSAPYVLVRAGLEAKVLRAPYYELAQSAIDQGGVLGVTSRGVFFPLEDAGS